MKFTTGVAFRGQGAAARKELRSMQELKVNMRDVFYFDNGLVLTTLCIITQNTVNLILMG